MREIVLRAMIKRRATPPPDAKLKRRIIKDGLRPNEQRDAAIRRVIRSIPKGKVATYGQVAAAAGYPLYHRLVAKLLRGNDGSLPWQRVLGAGGEIKLHQTAAYEQRLRLEMEGVKFKGKRVDMAAHQYRFRTWELDD
ncbi:MAG TPA: MGMT family protein [Bryobacteraceae bacterium]|jgi:methylated-DNA-protein-cysteine methyltransferase related protein|nr:MGMT family protein [Bryobacteraceae bacterium]